MKKLNKFIFSKNVWTVFVGSMFVWLAFSAMANMLGPRNSNQIFLHYLEMVFISFCGAGVIITIMYKILNRKLSNPDLGFSFWWVFVLALGSLFFAYLFSNGLFEKPSINFELFMEVFTLSFVSSALFRILINFIISFFPNSQDSVISVVNK